MTKTLTEQWKDGELEEGYYYVLVKDYPEIVIDEYATWYDRNGKSKKEFTFGASIEEVLRPVPTLHEYDEILQKIDKLKEKLEIARIVLGQIAMFSSDKADAVQCAKAIKEMSGVENDEKR